MVDLVFYECYAIGAAVVWLLKGCRTSYADELGEQETRNGMVRLLILFGPIEYLSQKSPNIP